MSKDWLPSAHSKEILSWITSGRVPESKFVCAIIQNNLRGAIAHGDPEDHVHLSFYIRWLACNAPEGSWGTPFALENWALFCRARNNQEKTNGN